MGWLLEKSRNLLNDVGAGLACLFVDQIHHLVQLAASFLHLRIVELLVAPDRPDLVNDASPTVVHALGCHGKTGLAVSENELIIYEAVRLLANESLPSDLCRLLSFPASEKDL